MNDFIKKIIGDLEGKKEWKALEARANKLPEDYKAVYDEIKHFVWQGGTGALDPSNLFKRMVTLFEEGAASGKHVLDVTGKDVAAFVSELTRGEKTYVDELKAKLNDTITKKLK